MYMNKIFTFIVLLFGLIATSQVGIGTDNPDPAAVLDVNSEISSGVYGGLKLPTMTLAERATIPTPIPDGLMIYVLDGATRCVQVWDATQSSWMNWYCMNQLPVASAVNYSGTTDVGETLSGSYNYTDVENDLESGTSFQWYRATDASGTGSTPIAGATSIDYITTIDDGDQFVALGVTPQASSGASPGAEVLSTYQEISFLQTLVEFDRNATTIPEGDFRTIPITVTNPNPNDDTMVEINVDSGNISTFGILGTDYTIDNNGTNVTSYPFTVIIPGGNATFTNLTITVLQDNNNAINEELFLTLENPSGGTNAALSGVQDNHTVFSSDDENATEVEFTTTSSTIEEPLTPSNDSTISIAITNPSSSNDTTVQVTLNVSSTVDPGDYTINYNGSPVTFPFTVTFPAGQATNESFTVTSLNDPDASDELLNIELNSPSGGIATTILGTNDTHDLTINDDDIATVVEFDSVTYSEVEDGSVGQLDVTITNPAATATTVEVAISGTSTATNGVDYDTDTSGTALTLITLTFPANSSASLPVDFFITNDADAEGDETIIFTLQNPSGGFLAQLGTNTTSTFTIVDDEAPVFLINEDFETDGAGTRYTQSDTQTGNDTTDYFTRTNGTTPFSISATFNNEDGFYFAAQDIDAAPGVGDSSQELTFNSITTSGQTLFNFSIDVAEDDDGASQDWDGGTFFRIEYRLDGGGPWTTFFAVEGPNSTNGIPRVDANLNGIGDAGETEVTDTFTTFTGTLVTVAHTTIEFRFAFNLVNGDEDIAVDNFIIQ
jgi:hypothetical protein